MLLFAVRLMAGGALVASFVFALGVMVACVPEGLPATLSVALAIGVRRMARRSALIKKLVAVETLGSTTVICTDKTGTLTRAEMTVQTLVQGATSIKIHGRYVPVRADVVDVPGFSVHADADEVIGWLTTAARAPSVTYVIHGEPTASEALRDRISSDLNWHAVVPRPGEQVLI